MDKISTGVMKTQQGMSPIYHIACSCEDPDCKLNFRVIKDKELNKIILSIYGKTFVMVEEQKNRNFFRKLLYKIKIILSILMDRDVYVESEVILNDEKQIESLICALQEIKNNY